MPELTIGIASLIKDAPAAQMRFHRRFIDSLKFVKEKFNLVIVDNGSSEEGHNFLKTLNPDKLIKFPLNTGVVHAYNTIMENADTEYVYIPNSDHVLSENSVETLLANLRADSELFVVGSPDTRYVNANYEWQHAWQPKFSGLPNCGESNFLNDRVKDGIYSDLTQWNEEAQIFINKNKGTSMNEIMASNYMMTRDNWLKMGKFRMGLESQWPWWAMDSFFWKDCEKNGYKWKTCLDTLVYHDFHVTSTTTYVGATILPPIETLEFLQKAGTPFRRNELDLGVK